MDFESQLIRFTTAASMEKQTLRLFESMSLARFENGYWYVKELKDFAKGLGLKQVGKLRKDELEAAIRLFLQTGVLKNPALRPLVQNGKRDASGGLSPDKLITIFKNDAETKQFLLRESERIAPGLKVRSGARYRLNRWREKQIAGGVPLTYGDLVREWVRLNQSSEPFKRIPHGRYINFLSDFFTHEAGATREDAIRAWDSVKALNIPKDYHSWKNQSGIASTSK